MDDKRDGDDCVRLDPHQGRYFCDLCKCPVGAKNIPEHVNGKMHRTRIQSRATVERVGYLGDNRRDDDGRAGRRRDFDNRRDDRGGRWADAPPSPRHGSSRGHYGDSHARQEWRCDREQRGDGLCDAFGRLRLQASLCPEERVNAKQQQRAAPMRMPTETKVPAETRADVQSKVEAGGGGPSCFDGIRIDHGHYGPTKERYDDIPAKDVRETNGWKQKENINIKPNCIHPNRPSGVGMISAKKVNSLSLIRIELISGLDSVERAESLCNACRAKCSMLHTVLDKIGFRGSLVDENSNINGVRCYKVMVKKLHTASNDRYSIIFEYSAEEKIPEYRMRKLLAIFTKHSSAGFLEWLGGAKGWRFDCPTTEGASWKKCAVIQLNTLQEVFKLFAVDSQKYFFENSQRMVWRKQNELTDVVNDIRVWIETITPQSELTRKMLRNSSTGPESLVHWAHHHPVRSYDYQYHFSVVIGIPHSMSSLLGISNSEIISPFDCCIGINYVGAGGGVWY